MAADPQAVHAALQPLQPGPLELIGCGELAVTVAPQAGGRIAQIRHGGVDHLVGHAEAGGAMIAWGCYPMLPWAGRIRNGLFSFAGQPYRLPANLGAHAIHGFGFAMPWQVESQQAGAIELSLQLPRDARWPFGGSAHQRLVATENRLQMDLSLRAETWAMPAVIGWHPWFRKPGQVRFDPESIYPRDRDGIATLPLASPPPGPWDDCFINHHPVLLEIDGSRLQLSSDCGHWVVYDATSGASCFEPQSGPPDAFNLQPFTLEPGATLHRQFVMEWASY